MAKATASKTIRTNKLYRTHQIDEITTRAEGDGEEPSRVLEFSFSSETPVERFFGMEILDHARDSVDLAWMGSGRAPFLMDHRTGDQIGVIEAAWIDQRTRSGRARARLSRSVRATEIAQDIADGIRSSISVGYRITRLMLEEASEDGPNVYRATEWTPFEASLVSIPADQAVGIGREDSTVTFETILEEPDMARASESTAENEQPTNTSGNEPAKPPPIDVEKERTAARDAETSRVREIMELGSAWGLGEAADKAVREGQPLEDFRGTVLKELERGHSAKYRKPKSGEGDIGMSDREAQKFSFVRLMNALASPDKSARDAAGFELEACRAATEKRGGNANGVIIPQDILSRNIYGERVDGLPMQRDLTVGTPTAGGHTVSTDLLAQSFIDLLVNRTAVMNRVTMLRDLMGNIAIPRQTGGTTAYWVSEGNAPTESSAAFDQVTMSPETVGAFTDISRRLLIQSSLDVEAFVRMDLARTLALELDRVILHGSGSGSEPEGIANTSGIGSVIGGTDGAEPDWADIVDLETAVADDNADMGDLAYVTNARVRGKLKQTEKATGTAQFIWGAGGELNGYNAVASNQVRRDLDKGTSTGVCSAIFFGNWRDAVMGMWSGLDLLVDPYTASTSGTVRVVVHQDVDFAVRHAESFAAMLDALTS